MPIISLHKTDSFSPEFYLAYSRFKHGSKTQARIFGEAVAAVCDFEPESNLVFYAAPFNNIQTASNAFKDYLLSYCSTQFMKKNILIKQGHVYREYSYDGDYGLMNAEQRKAAISSDLLYIDKNFLNDKDTLVFIDDIKITGSHEARIREILLREGIKNKVIFIYIAEYTGNNPQIEHDLNHSYVNCLTDINDIIRNEEFIFNIRVVKYILKADIQHFVSFITYQSNLFRETLYSHSIFNNYQNNPKYKNNFDILKNLI